jgi:hypothetical protein
MRVKLTVEIDSENEAFQDETHCLEVARIMQELAQKLSNGAEGYFTLNDINGNYVGNAIFEAWEEED